jgi:hypothetical protein
MNLQKYQIPGTLWDYGVCVLLNPYMFRQIVVHVPVDPIVWSYEEFHMYLVSSYACSC